MLQYCFKMLCLSKCNSFGSWKQHITSSPTLSRNIRPKSSRLAEPLWTDPGLKSGISVRENTPLPKTQTHRNTDTDTDTQTQTQTQTQTHTHTHTHKPQKTKQKQTSAGGEEWSNILPKSSQARKNPPLPCLSGILF